MQFGDIDNEINILKSLSMHHHFLEIGCYSFFLIIILKS